MKENVERYEDGSVIRMNQENLDKSRNANMFLCMTVSTPLRSICYTWIEYSKDSIQLGYSG